MLKIHLLKPGNPVQYLLTKVSLIFEYGRHITELEFPSEEQGLEFTHVQPHEKVQFVARAIVKINDLALVSLERHFCIYHLVLVE